jgi:serine O-acetyltransferase
VTTTFDLAYYKAADRLALGVTRRRPRWLFGDDIWKYQIALRHHEYWLGRRKSIFNILAKGYWHYKYYTLGIRLNFEIPPYTTGPGLSLAHRGPVIINPGTRIGKNCRIHSCVNIGTAAGTRDQVPTIGDGVYIGPGAKLFGAIVIADDVAIAAQAVVNRSCTTPGVTLGGIPARVIAERGSSTYIIDGAGLAAQDAR